MSKKQPAKRPATLSPQKMWAVVWDGLDGLDAHSFRMYRENAEAYRTNAANGCKGRIVCLKVTEWPKAKKGKAAT